MYTILIPVLIITINDSSASFRQCMNLLLFKRFAGGGAALENMITNLGPPRPVSEFSLSESYGCPRFYPIYSSSFQSIPYFFPIFLSLKNRFILQTRIVPTKTNIFKWIFANLVRPKLKTCRDHNIRRHHIAAEGVSL